ncbi:glycosyltransferase family 1 protein [Scandinavium sp. V105_16]|uniref:Glycosyltransferase family 1 protein n=1 Tax=Scandinavium lactucae TaxID=3095028 RepID=A0AAJ2SA44_9ENTR|nr:MULTISPECIES: glycosyltransferase family 1 protein [unclassified Scandinavium]MDX6019724.1 glycosyltransferase family 1 protein [Scandinavium sp. V105_16]MDX6032834.1 glycosyltransferase family 1 protein [Scandinavium sp. V105_12]
MIKINLVSLYYEANRITGANKRFDFFARSLLKRNDVKVIAVVKQGEEPAWADDVITVPRYDRLPAPVRRILHFVHLSFLCFKLDGIIINDFMPVPLFSARKKNYYQLVHDIRNFTEYNRALLKNISSHIQKMQWKKVSNILTVSEFTKTQLVDYCGVNPENVFVSYNGIEETIRVPSRRDIDFLYIATFEKRKNHKNLVLAFSEYVKNVDPNSKLVLVGRDLGYRGGVHTLIEDLSLADNVSIIDNISEKELLNLYERSCCFVSPSLYEGFGMPIIEAMYFGCNVACSNIAVFQEIAKEYADYFDPKDVMDIFRTLQISRGKSNDDAGQVTYVCNHFYWDAIADSFLQTMRN